MRRALMLALSLALLPGCSGDSKTDAAVDARIQDYAVIEGPTTNPIVDLPVHPTPDLTPADLGTPADTAAE